MIEYIKPFTTWLHLHPHFAGMFAFLVAFAESLAIIGSIVPGSVTLTAIGVLMGTGVIPVVETMVWAICGAIIGDALSFWFGWRYQEHLRDIWPLSKYPQLLTNGERFFEKHGGKSIFLGRFVGPIRAILPLVVGMMKMPVKKFMFYDVVSGIFWAPAYLLPGMLVGAATLELAPETATRFIMIILLALIVVSLITWLVKYSFVFTAEIVDNLLNKTWAYMRRHKTLRPLTIALQNPAAPDRHGQLALAVFFVLTILALTALILIVGSHPETLDINQLVYHFNRSMRLDAIDKVAVLVTFFSDKYVLVGMFSAMSAWLAFKRLWRVTFHWVANGIIAGGIAYGLKYLVHSIRPTGEMIMRKGFSFPSGHTTLSMALYGFLAVIIAIHIPRDKRWRSYAPFATLVTIMALSRVYLGAHWFTDVLGGCLVGMATVMLTALSYRRVISAPVALGKLLSVAFISLIISWSVYAYSYFSKELYAHSLYWKVTTVTSGQWWKQKQPLLPEYRNNRLGNPHMTLNIQWSGELQQIEKFLSQNGWHTTAEFNLYDMINRVAAKDKTHYLPLLPKLYQHQRPVLVMTKNGDDKKPIAILRLWKSNYEFSDNKQLLLWIGSLHYRILRQNLWLPFHGDRSHKLMPATGILLPMIEKDFNVSLRKYSLPAEIQRKQQPNKTYSLLLIRKKK